MSYDFDAGPNHPKHNPISRPKEKKKKSQEVNNSKNKIPVNLVEDLKTS